MPEVKNASRSLRPIPFSLKQPLLACFVAILFVTITAAGPVTLDPAFGDGGMVTTNLGQSHDYLYDMALQADGKIVGAGLIGPGNNISKAGLVRFNGDGSVDTSFGREGFVYNPFATNQRSFGTAVAVQGDGRIVVAGYITTMADPDPLVDLALARYLADGTPDPTFGDDGVVVFDRGGDEAAADLVLAPDGQIVVVGATLLLRFKPDGTLDGEFGTDGIVAGAPSQAVTVDGTGKILAVGGSTLARYNADGTIDSSFGSSGQVTTPAGRDLLVEPDGQIVTAGSSGSTYVAARYNGDGTPDSNFSGDGLVSVPVTNGRAHSVSLQADGKIIIAGAHDGDFGVLRLDENGSVDTTFGTGGMVVTDFGEYETAEAVLVDGGRIVVGGGQFVQVPEAYFALAGYNPDGSLDTAFGSEGKVLANGGGRNEAYALAIQADGKIVAAGYAQPGWCTVARYQVDGRLDPAFGTGGTALPCFGQVRDLAIQSDGKLVLAVDKGDVALVRLQADGTLDTTFDGGEVTVDLGGQEATHAVALQADGKVLVTGYTTVNGDRDPFLLRFDGDGTPDATFGVNGAVIGERTGSDDAWAVVVQADGTILVGGAVAEPARLFAIWRYQADGAPDSTFGSGGIAILPPAGTIYDLILQPEDKIVAAGYGKQNFVLARVHGDGTLDSTFGSGGTVETDIATYDLATAVVAEPGGELIVAGTSYDDYLAWSQTIVLARYSADGTPDSAFGSGGTLATALTADLQWPDIALQDDGKIVVAGTLGQGTGADMVVARYQVWNEVVFLPYLTR